MLYLFLVLASLTLIIVAVEGMFWSLFRRKMEPLRFPSDDDPSGSHIYWLERVRLIVIVHAVLLIIVVWMFCIWLW
jgi:hypothetical protein